MYTDPQFASAALLTIDVQCDTLDGAPFEIPGTSAALPRIGRLAEAFRASGRPIFHVVRIYLPDGSNVDLCRRALIEAGRPLLLAETPGVQIAHDILPHPGVMLETPRLLSGDLQSIGPSEHILYKPRWGAFYRTSLEAVLGQWGVTTLVFTGCNYPNCPRTSIYQASERDFRVVLVSDALSGLYATGCTEMRNIGVNLMEHQEVIEALGSPASRAVSARPLDVE
jgi:nicotinamidase-related amidase